MTRPSLVLALALALTLSACAGAPVVAGSADPEVGWIDLQADGLDGWIGGTTHDPQALVEAASADRAELEAGWTAQVAEHWHIDGDELVSDGHGPHLVTARDFGDFELELEWKIQPGADSGIYLRGYPQVQVWDPGNEREAGNGAGKGSGGLWNNDVHDRWPAERADRTPGQWNRMTVAMRGSLVWVTLNDRPVVAGVELDNYFRRGEPLLERGPIHLQTHNGEVRFRGVRVREL